MNTLIAQWKADIIRTSRDKRFFLLTLAMPVILYLMFAKETSGLQTQNAGSLSQNAYLMVSMSAFGVIGSSVNTLAVRLAAERQNGWTTYLRTTPMPSITYAVGKAFTQLTLALAIILAVFFVGHFFKGVSFPWTTWIDVGLWLWLASLPFAVLGILIGMTGSSAQVLGTLAYLALAVLGGLLGTSTGTLQNIGKWLPTHYFAQPGWDLLQGKGPSLADIAVLVGYTVIFIVISAVLQNRSADLRGLIMKKYFRYVRFAILGLVVLWFLIQHHII